MTAWAYESETQHSRRCRSCGTKEYGKHILSDWKKLENTQHTRKCTLCNDSATAQWENHYSDDVSCNPTCDGCHTAYVNLQGEHGAMTEWQKFDDTRHYRFCTMCDLFGSREYEDHIDSDNDSECDVCGACRHANVSDWESGSGMQHKRRCEDCGENLYGNHNGGTANCNSFAVCEVCNSEYGEISTEHVNMSEWKPYASGTQHYSTCLDCGIYNQYADHVWGDWTSLDGSIHVCECVVCKLEEEGNHTGGEATCQSLAICEDCSFPYGAVDPNGHVMTDWYHYSDTQHYRYCWVCMDTATYEYEAHSGGTATCTAKAVCEACGARYGELYPDNHKMSDWRAIDLDQHYRFCIGCRDESTYEYEDHCGGIDGSCSPICDACGESYVDSNGQHGSMREWEPFDDDQHVRWCEDCRTSEYEAHNGGTATCVAKAVCTVCGDEYGTLATNNHSWGEWKSNGDGTHTRICANDAKHTETEDCTGGTATCTEEGVCEVCDGTYIPAIQHSWGEWKSNGDGTHTRICANDVTHTETEDCTGGTATCTDKAECESCAVPYGDALGHIPGTEADCTHDQLCTREGCGEVLTEKFGHDYTAIVTKPTCTKLGYTTYTCSRCEDSYQADQTAARGHWYDLWYPNGDGTHSADCKRYGCSHEGTTECTLYEVTVKDGETETILTVCPVCGDHVRAIFGVVCGATIKNVYINQPLPCGEQIVRELDAPFDGVLYAFTAAYESAGHVVPFNGKVSVSLPLDAEKYAGFKLVRVDVTPATETIDRIEVWTDVAFTFENGRLTFEADVAGLFLLVSME